MPHLPPRATRFLLLLCIFSLSLYGCGGGSSSSPIPGDNLRVSGTVEDGPLQNAVVILYDKLNDQVAQYCGSSGQGRCESVSKEDGSFSFSINPGVYLPNFYAQATGGIDTVTGVDFSDVTLRAPLSLYEGQEEEIIVSPLTTLLQEQVSQGSTLEEALQATRTWLNLPSTSDLGASPSSDPQLLRCTLLLSKIMLESRKQGISDPLVFIGQDLSSSHPLLSSSGQLDTTAVNFLQLDESALAAISTTYDALKQTDTDLSRVFQHAEFIQQTTDILNRMLQTNSSFDATDANYLANAQLLAEDILAAAGDTIIPLGGQVPAKLLKYVFFAYNLISFDTDGNIEPTNFLLPPAEFAALLVNSETSLPLTSDSQITALASTDTLYSVSVPLLSDEMPGDDNLKRAQYYYQSDASHLYQAQRVVSEVFDDEINDSILLNVVSGKAAAGLIDEAVSTIENEMWLTLFKGRGYVEVANALSGVGRTDEAYQYLVKAERYLKLAVDKIGPANVTDGIVNELQYLSKSYLKAGDLDGAYGVADYLYNEIAPYTTGVIIVYTRTFIAIREIFDAYLEQGYAPNASALAEILLDLAWNTPYDSAKRNYRQRVYNLVETAQRFRILGDLDTVYSIYQEVIRLRAEPDLTALLTNGFMDELSLTLYDSGFETEALALIDTIDELNKSKALKLLATNLAVNDGLGEEHISQPSSLDAFSALDFVAFKMIPDKYNTIVEDSQIEALTYFAKNKSVPYIGLGLIQAGRLSEAEQALEKAVNIVTGLPADQEKPYVGGSKVDCGYAKVADLYIDMAENEAATDVKGYYARSKELLSKGEDVINKEMTDPDLQASGRTALAEVYLRLGEVKTAENLLQRDATVDEYPTIVRSFINLGDFSEALIALDKYFIAAQEVFTITTPLDEHDTVAKNEVKHLLITAELYGQLGDTQKATTAIDLALDTAREVYLSDKRNDELLKVIAGYSQADAFDKAIDLANNSSDFPTTDVRYQALLQIAEAYSVLDAFPDTTVASVDTDHDGKPDFFNPLATAEEINASGLLLDDDCDGDGIIDVEDHRPLFAD